MTQKYYRFRAMNIQNSDATKHVSKYFLKYILGIWVLGNWVLYKRGSDGDNSYLKFISKFRKIFKIFLTSFFATFSAGATIFFLKK